MTTAVIVVAAGGGTRLGAEVPKAFVAVGGVSLLARAVDAALGMSVRPRVVAVVPEATAQDARALLPDDVTVVAGGPSRQASVAAGLVALGAVGAGAVSAGAVNAGSVDAGGVDAGSVDAGGVDAGGVSAGGVDSGGVDVVLVHDAARAFMPARVFDVVEAEVVRTGVGVVPGLPVVDTMKRVDFAGSSTRVASTVDRSELRAVQTPQGFPLGDLVAAYAAASGEHTDDAALFAAAGHEVTVVDGDPLGFKVTTPADLDRARSLAPPQSFVGLGVDVHAFVVDTPDAADVAASTGSAGAGGAGGAGSGGSLWLGDVEWPGERPLAGHSDGDVLSHAICDALLSAAGLGDVGSVFGTADARFAGAHGGVFIAETVALIAGAGFAVGNVAVQVLGNRPRVSERRAELEAHLSGLVGAPVRVSASTTDGLGFAGRGEGLTAIAMALLTRP